MASLTPRPVRVFPNANYKILKDESRTQPKEFMDEKMMQLMHKFNEQGRVETVQVVMLVEQHGHPHVLLLQPHPKFSLLPNTEMKSGETTRQSVERLLKDEFHFTQENLEELDLVDLLGVWWRPHFEQLTYPYLPPHVTKPKERLQVFLAQLPESSEFVVPSNCSVRAVALMELFDSKENFGALISTLPHALSRFNFIMSGKEQGS